jgi:hypothetical protein
MKSLLITILLALTFTSISCRSIKKYSGPTKYPKVKRPANTKICESIHEILNGTSTLCFIDQFKTNLEAKKICAENEMKLMNFETEKGYNAEKSAKIESKIFEEWQKWVAPYFKRHYSSLFWITENEEKLEKCSATYYKVEKFEVRERQCDYEFKFFCQF